MPDTPLVPDDFEPPRTMEAEDFQLRPLDYEVMLQDFEAVVTGASGIAKAYQRDESYYRNFTLQDEVIEIGWHMGEWRRRNSFAYAIMSHDGERCFGSFYIYRTPKCEHDAMGILWTIPDPDPEFDTSVFETVAKWVDVSWPFATIGYPGRRLSWEDWRALP